MTRDGAPAPAAPWAGDAWPGRLNGPAWTVHRAGNALVPEDLYAEVLRGAARRSIGRIELTPASLVTTNTYWGRLHTYWQRWTAVDEVQVSLRARAGAAGSG
ncbi:hypothetical protein HBB16_08100 [Pseudonocardia sp. MCCB 268]|nr:hypothetical protein [Pseudonocardia cytotoxica]